VFVINLTLVILVPVYGLFVALRSEWRWGQVWRIAAIAAIASLATIGLMGAVNAWLGGQWFVLRPSLQVATNMLSAPNPYKRVGWGWLRVASWLVLPAFATLAAMISLARSRSRGWDFARTLQVTFLAAVVVFGLLQARHVVVFEYAYYVSYLVPFALIALALHAGPIVDERGAPVVILVVSCALALAHWFVLSEAHVFWNRLLALTSFPDAGVLAIMVSLVAGLLAVSAFALVRHERVRLVAFGVLFALSLGAVPSYWPSRSDPYTQSQYAHVVAAGRFVDENSGGKNLRFWYEVNPASKWPFRSISSSYLWASVLINESLPAITPAEAATIDVNSRLVLLAHTEDDVAPAAAALRRFGFDYRVLARQTIGEGERSFVVLIAEFVRQPGAQS
jgi:hypothetical protein